MGKGGLIIMCKCKKEPDFYIKQEKNRSEFRKKLEELINCTSMENGSNTPDWILADFLNKSLELFDETVNLRSKWYNGETKPIKECCCFKKEEPVKFKDGLTINPEDERLGHGANKEPVPQNEAYLVLSTEEREKGFVRPVRDSYIHDTCGQVTKMDQIIAETFARDPKFYKYTYCTKCQKHLPVEEFTWCYTNKKVGE